MMEMGRERQRMVGVYGQKLRGNYREAEGSMGRQGVGMDLPRLAFASGYGPGGSITDASPPVVPFP